MAIQLQIKVQPNLVKTITGAYGSIGYKRGNNNHVIDFYIDQHPKYFKNGGELPMEKCPKTIKASIANQAHILGFLKRAVIETKQSKNWNW